MKNKKFLFVLPIIGLICLVNSCCLDYIRGNGRVVSRDRAAGSFYGVCLTGTGNVNIHQAGSYRVTITTDSNIQDYIEVRNNNNMLQISEKFNYGLNATRLVIDVYLPRLEIIDLKGSGNFKIVDGKNANLQISMSGTGNIDAQNFEAANVIVNLSGFGDVKVWATNSITGKISGFGNLYYRGNPLIINVNRTGIGEIKKLK